MTETASSAVPLVQLSPPRLHELALESFRVGNRGRLTLCQVLRVLADSRQYHELGSPSIEAYARKHFQLRRTETLEHVRVARALDGLPRLREAFAEGRVRWTVVKEISRVATAETEEAWLAEVASRRLEEVLAEVRDARKKGRAAPRADRFGLPNLNERLVVEFPLAEMEKLRLALGCVARQLAERTGQAEVTPAECLLYLAERELARDAQRQAAEAKGAAPVYAVLYQQCPTCERAAMATSSGPVEVEREVVERVKGDALLEVIRSGESAGTDAASDAVPGGSPFVAPADRDRPTPPALRRKILLREAGRCANPYCGRPATHCHHVQSLAHGGRTVLSNEIAVCGVCHALIHAGLLKVTGTPGADLRWTTRDDGLTARVRRATRAAGKLPVFRVESGIPDRRPSGIPDNGDGIDADALAEGLVRQGCRKLRARQLVEQAWQSLPPERRTESAVLRKALALW
jgi:hypothetical protein